MLDYKLIVKFIEELLVSFKFKKNKSSFIKEINDVLQILEIQKYTFKIDGQSAFTIKIGLVVPNTFQKVFGTTVTPSVSKGVIYFNVGELLNDFNGRVINKHWVLNGETKLKLELESLFTEKVIPFFNSIDTPKAILAFAEQNKIVSKSTSAVKRQLEELKHKTRVQLGG